MTEKTCKERVSEKLKDRIQDIKKLWQAYCDGEEEVEDLGSIYDYGLCFDYVAPDTFEDQKEAYFRWQLSWGGPADEFRFYANPDLSLYRIEYWFLDWFDGAGVELEGEDFMLLSEIFDWFKETGAIEKALEEVEK